MGVKYENYYDLLGVKRDAESKDIKKAYHKLAREFHPDVNKNKDAEEKFKKINEAYEVLKDPEKRKLYDQLGSNWQAGQDFNAPPGWNSHGDFGHDGSSYHYTGNADEFSDFFELLFGGGRGRRSSPFDSYGFGQQEGYNFAKKGADREAELELTFEEAYHGGSKKVRLSIQEPDAMGRIVTSSKEYDVRIPKGVTTGSRIRLKGMGEAGSGRAAAGDLFLNVKLKDTASIKHKGHDLYLDFKVSPWEAMLGGKVDIPALSGTVQMTLPRGAQTDHKYRLKEKGLPSKNGFGDLYVVIKIVVPDTLTEDEEKLVQELEKISKFNPRGKKVV